MMTNGSNHSRISLGQDGHNPVIDNDAHNSLPYCSTAPSSSPISAPHGFREELATTSVAVHPSELIICQPHRTSLNTSVGFILSAYGWVTTYVSYVFVLLWSRLYSISDIRTIVRFIVVIFSHLMGIWTALSVSVMPGRSGDALPSTNDDSYPVMIAQVVASMLSPLLFTVVSTKEDPTPLRQRITSFYYVLLVVGVLMSLASLLLYSFWPLGYRVTNLTIIASLMFGVLGSWQFLEKSWKTSSVNEEIELGLRQA